MDTKKPLLESIDPEIVDRLVSRRDAIKQGAGASALVTAGLAMGSLPVALGALSSEVYGQATSRTVLDVLRFAFILENLENEFYLAVLGRSSLAAQNTAFAPVRATLTAAERAVFEQIAKHETAHVVLLRAAITANGGTPANITAANFDFTGGNGSGTGPFAAATNNKEFLLAATQGFEDTGVRAYKGQAAFLMSSPATLETALRIHSVEARHAAKVRKMRREASTGTTVLRYSGTVRGGAAAAAGAPAGVSAAVAAAFNLIYGGATPESNVTHAGINVATGLSNVANVTELASSATEAFDEALTADEVIAIVRDFIIDNAALGLP
jgi:rubrerythrin